MRHRHFAAVAATIMAFGAGRAQAASAVELGATLVALQQLDSMLGSTINTVDGESAARIRQVQITVEETIEEVKDVMDHGYGLVNNTREHVMGDVGATMAATQGLVSQDEQTAMIGVNQSLANVATIVTAIPFVKVPAYAYAVEPMRLKGAEADKQIKVFGFFPDATEKHPIIAKITQEGEQSTQVGMDRDVGGAYSFILPKRFLNHEESYLNVEFVIPIKHMLGIYYTSSSMNQRIYVAKSRPFKFDISVDGENPQLWATVPAGTSYAAHADHNRTSNTQTVTAPELFSQTVNDNVKYDMSTAQITSLQSENLTQGINACVSGCTASSGSRSWNQTGISYSLSAPDCPIHLITPPCHHVNLIVGWTCRPEVPYQCSGGTHADYTVTPIFKVKRRDVDPEVTLSTTSVVAGNGDTTQAIPANWTSIQIVGTFKDGSESRRAQVRLTSGPNGVSVASEPLIWRAEVQGNSLVLTGQAP